jgi:hypothetical protein
VAEVAAHLRLGQRLVIDHVVEVSETAELLDHDNVMILILHPDVILLKRKSK